MTEKMTNAKALMFVKDNYDLPSDVAEKIDKMIVSYANKSANRKPTAKQVENDGLKDIILAVVTDEGATVSDIQTRDKRISASAGVSNQRVSALLRQLVAENKVTKEVSGKKSLFRLA